ncbi:unnamed protein product, partial [marine sediment metagenome]
AIVSFGPLVDEVRGSLGGVTFSNAGTGATVRSRPRPPRPKTPDQVRGQSYLAQGAAMWDGLSGVTRDAWQTYAESITLTDSLAREYSPTGRQALIWSYCIKAHGGLTPAWTVPTGLGLAVIPTLTLFYSAPAMTLSAWDPAPNAASQFIIMIYYADRIHAYNRMRRLAMVAPLGNVGLPLTLAADINSNWPDGTELRCWISVRMFDEDLKISTRLMQSADFTAVVM